MLHNHPSRYLEYTREQWQDQLNDFALHIKSEPRFAAFMERVYARWTAHYEKLKVHPARFKKDPIEIEIIFLGLLLDAEQLSEEDFPPLYKFKSTIERLMRETYLDRKTVLLAKTDKHN